MTRFLKHPFSHFHQQGSVSFAVRTPEHPRLTKPASAGAAACYFQCDAVVNCLHQRNNGS
jgi:hypothetical protein